MSLQKWVKLSSEVFHENKWWQGICDRFRLPNGKEGNYYYVSVLGTVMIVAVNFEGKILLHRQYRYLFDKISLELPCGGIKPSQNPETAAQAELAEETGFSAKVLKKIGYFLSSNGLTNQVCHVFLARDLFPAVTEKDETEDFEAVTMSPQEIDQAIISGEIDDGLVIASWTLAKPYLKK
ncbi:MAG: NUDIX hydrolase [Candidatus Uhrbacteria bacterium]